jgi:hypothetical protein
MGKNYLLLLLMMSSCQIKVQKKNVLLFQVGFSRAFIDILAVLLPKTTPLIIIEAKQLKYQ